MDQLGIVMDDVLFTLIMAELISLAGLIGTVFHIMRSTFAAGFSFENAKNNVRE